VQRECEKFLRFAYLLDFLALEALNSVFKESVLLLELKMESLVAKSEDIEIEDVAANRKPMFLVTLNECFEPISEKDITESTLLDFAMPPLGNSEPEDFNILYHVKLKKEHMPDSQLSSRVFDYNA